MLENSGAQRDYFFLQDESFANANSLFAVHGERSNAGLVEGLRKVKFIQRIVTGLKHSANKTFRL